VTIFRYPLGCLVNFAHIGVSAFLHSLGSGGGYGATQTFIAGAVVSSNAYSGGTRPIANKTLIGGFQKIFLKQVNNPMFHLLVLTNSVKPIAVPTAQQNPNHLRSLLSSRILDCTILGELTREVFRRRFAPKRRSR
jgi:hypothetical protein